MYITRPSSLVSFVLNTMLGNVMAYKVEVENMIRKSGVDYVIVRPGGLNGDRDESLDPYF